MKKEKILPAFLFLVSISLILFLAENVGLIRPIRGVVERITIPLRTGLYRTWQGVSSSLSSLTILSSGPKKIAELENQARELASLKVKLFTLEEENKALRRQLEAPLSPTLKFLPAKTIGLTRFLTIDKGEEDGVKVGMTVLSENILVGKIASVTAKTAQVVLPTDPDSKIPVRTLKTNARGLIVGEFGTKAVLDKVLQSERLEQGDLVITTGEGEFLKDLLVAKISKVSKNEVEPFQTADVLPFLEYGRLENVFLIK